MRIRLAVLLLLGLLGLARAEDQRLAGSKLVLRKSAAAEHLVLVARDGVVAPLPGGGEDPTRVGALLDIGNPRTAEWARFEMPSRDWRVNAVGTVFRFRNHLEKGPGSEVRALVVKHERKLKISTRALGITLDEEAQRALSVVLTTGTRRYCLLFGGTIGKDKPGRFVARNAPAPIACPAPIVVSSTTTTSRPPGTRPTSTSVTSSTNVTNSTSATSSTSTTSTPVTLPLGTTMSSTTSPAGSSTSSTKAPTAPTTTTSRPPTTTTTSPSTPTTSSTSVPPPTTTSTSPPPTTTSSSAPPPPTTSTSTQSVPTTSTTTSTKRECGFRGNSCKGTCPLGFRCAVVLSLCTCLPL